jgi:outer membrane protein TolC
MYIQAYDLDMAKYLAEEEVQLLERVQGNKEALFEQGMLAQIDLEVSQIELAQKKLELLKYDYQKQKLYATFKNTLGINPEDVLKLNELSNENSVIDSVPLNEEIEMTLQSNVELQGLLLDLEVKQSNYDLYMNRSGRTFGDEYESLSDDLEYYVNLVRDKKSAIEASVRYGYRDVLSKLQAYNNQEKVHENAALQYKNVKASYEQGLITLTELNQAELLYHSAWKGLFRSKRDLDKAKLKYNVMIENGILYN